MDSTFPGPDEPEKTSRQGLTALSAEASILARRAWARAAHDTFADLQSQRLAAHPLARS